MTNPFLSDKLNKVKELQELIKQSFQPMPAAPAPGQAPPAAPAQGQAPAPAPGQPQVDPNTGMQIDPNTGLLIDPNSGMLIDPASGQMIDPATGQPVQGGSPAPAQPGAPAEDPNAAAGGTPPPIPDELVQALEEMSAAINQMAQKQAEQDEIFAEIQDNIKRFKSEIQDAQDLAYDAMKEVRKGRLA
jgi:hypothetical protein